MSSIYRDQIIDYYKFPRNKKQIPDATMVYGDKNPLCGDEVTFYIKLGEDNTVTDVGFQGVGCAISQASSSLLTEVIIGMSIDEIKQLTNDDIKEMLGIPLTPVRLKCAILSLKVVEGAVHHFEGGEVGKSTEEEN